MVATIESSPLPRVTRRRALFSMSAMAASQPHANYDIAPNGETFVMVRRNTAARIMVIQNLPALVQRLSGDGRSGR